jgi:hypothetical protein
MSKPISPTLEEQLEKDQKLLEAIKAHLPQLERLLFQFRSDYEDRMYRFYYNSFKVYSLQDSTLQAADLFRTIGRAVERTLCAWFEEIVAGGTGLEFEMEHNRDWLRSTRPIVEAFLHAKYFLEMMVKYGQELDHPAQFLPTGWAAILL